MKTNLGWCKEHTPALDSVALKIFNFDSGQICLSLALTFAWLLIIPGPKIISVAFDP